MPSMRGEAGSFVARPALVAIGGGIVVGVVSHRVISNGLRLMEDAARFSCSHLGGGRAAGRRVKVVVAPRGT